MLDGKKTTNTKKSFNGITRRKFIKGAAALGVTAAASPLLIPKLVSAAKPKKGGFFKIGYHAGNTNDSFDPRTMTGSEMYFPSFMMRNSLVEIDHKGNAIPELAMSWEVSDDLKTWVLNLRKGVEFHNGKSFEAEDVLYSLNIHRGETKSAAKSLMVPVKDIKADGKHRVIVELKSGNIDFDYVLTDYHFAMVPAGTDGLDWEKGIGTGGYVLQHFEPGVRIQAKRNPNYWKEGRAHFDEIEITVIHDVSARSTALKSGKIHYNSELDTKTAKFMQKDQNLKVLNIPSNDHFTMPMRADTSPYDKLDTSLALKYAIDREKIVKIVLNGFGTVGNDHPIGQGHKYYAADLPQRQYDPEKAKYHLKKAGLEGFTFDLSTMDRKGMTELALVFKEHAAEAGIKINVIKKPNDGYWSNVWMNDPFVVATWNGRSNVDNQFTAGWVEKSDWNECYWKNKRFNELLELARKEKDDKKRGEMYFEMQSICRDKAPDIVPAFFNHLGAMTKNVGFDKVASNAREDGFRLTERWWFES